MRTRAALIASALLIPACATLNNFAPPPISPVLIQRAEKDHASQLQITEGRTLFVHRCLECHTLPVVTKYSRDEWPHLVSRMSARADLIADEEHSVIAYLRAASTAATNQ